MTHSAALPDPSSHPGIAVAQALRGKMFAPAPPDLRSALLRARRADPGLFDRDMPEAGCALPPDPAPPGLVDHPEPVVTRLALALALARAHAAAGGGPIGATGGITRIAGCQAEAADTLRGLLKSGPVADAMIAPCARVKVMVDMAEANPSGREQASAHRRLRAEIDEALSAGRAVLLIAPDGDCLSLGQRALVETVLTLPRIDRRLIAALFSVLWPDHPEQATATDSLPVDEDLGRLAVVQLEAALRRTGPATAAAALARIAARLKPEAGGPGLDALCGQPEVRRVLGALADDLAAWRQGRLDWSAVPRSVLLSGPPGNGKTAAARAVAQQARLPLVTVTLAGAQAHGHLGDTLAALREAFDSAITLSPSILFIDEIDAIGNRTVHAGRNDFYVRAIVTGMLTMIERALRTPGLILLAATNDADVMDPALRRAGRFDQHIHVPPPDRDGLAAILARALGSAAAEIGAPALQSAARRLCGRSGADAEALGRVVLARARTAGRMATAADLEACLDARFPAAPPQDLRRVALHEAAHIVVGHIEGLPPPHRASASPGGAWVERRMPPLMTLASVEATLVTLLAGRAAEVHFMGAVSTGAGHGAGSDLAEATRLALHIDHAWHLDPDSPLIWSDVSTPPRPGTLPRDVAQAVSRRLRAAEARARARVAAHADAITAIASVLFVELELDAQQISELVLQYLPDSAEEEAPSSGANSAPGCGA